jgi:hypothetical protein
VRTMGRATHLEGLQQTLEHRLHPAATVVRPCGLATVLQCAPRLFNALRWFGWEAGADRAEDASDRAVAEVGGGPCRAESGGERECDRKREQTWTGRSSGTSLPPSRLKSSRAAQPGAARPPADATTRPAARFRPQLAVFFSRPPNKRVRNTTLSQPGAGRAHVDTVRGRHPAAS